MASPSEGWSKPSQYTPSANMLDSLHDEMLSKSFQQTISDQQLNLEHAKHLYDESLRGKLSFEFAFTNIPDR